MNQRKHRARGRTVIFALNCPGNVTKHLGWIMKQPVGIILAGGATRMGGGDKGLLPLGWHHPVACDRKARAASRRLGLNANGDPTAFL